jgi:hypothetical protein
MLFGLLGALFGIVGVCLVLITELEGTMVRITILLFLGQFVGTGLWLAANLIGREIPRDKGSGKTGQE